MEDHINNCTIEYYINNADFTHRGYGIFNFVSSCRVEYTTMGVSNLFAKR